jgi:tetratricopeptide (TPR) repeat protein
MIRWINILFIIAFNHLYAQVTPINNDPLNAIKTEHPYLIQAMEMIRFGDAAGAVRLLRQDANPVKQTFESDFLIGYAYKQTGDIDKAVDFFSKATRYEALSLPAFFERGNCYLIRKNFGQAVFDYDRAIVIDSTFIPAYNNRAYARIRNYGEVGMPTQQLKFARKDMETALRISAQNGDSNRFEYYYNIGLIDLYLSEYEFAKQAFNAAIIANPNVPKAYYYRGASQFLSKSYHAAADDFKKAEEGGFVTNSSPEFLHIIDLIKQHEVLTGERISK